MSPSVRVSFAALAVISFVSCTEVSAPDPAALEPSFDSVAVTGRVLFPDGSSYCDHLPPHHSPSANVYRLRPDSSAIQVGSTRPIFCPSDAWQMRNGVMLETGQRYAFIFDTDVHALHDASRFPLKVVDTFTVTGATTTQNLVVRHGAPLRGRLLLDGGPLSRIPVTFTSTLLSQLRVEAWSGADGAYEEDVSWPPEDPFRNDAYLQPGIEYRAECPPVGAAYLQSGSASPFTFGSESAFSCRYRSSAAAALPTHRAGSLALTAGPGNFGSEPNPDGARGWGVQFPADSVALDRNLKSRVQHMFEAGFLLLVDGAVLSTFDGEGHMICGATCRDFGTSQARAGVRTDSTGATTVSWRLTDAASAESRGIELLQRSYDGDGDYVVFRLAITNTSDVARTVSVGFFGDWDVGGFNFGQTATTAGAIAYTTDFDGPFMGSVFIGDYPERGFYGRSSFQGRIPLLDQESVLAGSLTNEGIREVDAWYIQRAGDIVIRPGRARVVWFAIVAGNTLEDMQAAAALAEADVQAR